MDSRAPHERWPINVGRPTPRIEKSAVGQFAQQNSGSCCASFGVSPSLLEPMRIAGGWALRIERCPINRSARRHCELAAGHDGRDAVFYSYARWHGVELSYNYLGI
jgi:hypothetical protein